jgi:hypothetical protein
LISSVRTFVFRRLARASPARVNATLLRFEIQPTLIIAEKPSVARLIAAVVGADDKKDGCFLGSGYIVSWCIGHLVEMQAANAYDERYAKWRYVDLPIIPSTWKYGRKLPPLAT